MKKEHNKESKIPVKKELLFENNDIKVYEANAFDTKISFAEINKKERSTTVCILPVRAGIDGKMEILTNVEFVPAWANFEDERFIVSISGGVNKGEDPLEAAVRELVEETGYRSKVEDFSFLGSTYVHKATNATVFCVLIDLTGKTPEERDPQDNIEKMIRNEWRPITFVIQNSVDLVLRNMAIEFMYTLLVRDAREVRKSQMKKELETTKPTRRQRRQTAREMEKNAKKSKSKNNNGN